MSEAPTPTDLMGPVDRPVLAGGRGRLAVLAVAVGSILPIAILRDAADPHLASWAARMRTESATAWEWLAWLGSPLAVLLAAVAGFGIAASRNWPNTARWMGVLALCVPWAALVDIAVGGTARGASTVGAVVMALVLWQPRAWPILAALGTLGAAARMVNLGVPASAAATEALLGALGPLVIEFGWQTAAPDQPLRRAAALRT